jgi:hypothetical protein
MNALYMLMLHKNATYCLKVRTEDVVGFGSYWMVLPTTQGFGLKRPKWVGGLWLLERRIVWLPLQTPTATLKFCPFTTHSLETIQSSLEPVSSTSRLKLSNLFLNFLSSSYLAQEECSELWIW